MLIRKLDPDAFVRAYNVDLQLLYPWEGVVEPPFGAAWAVLAPGESTKPHAHQECETFFIARGRGEMSIGDETVEVGPGAVSFHRPFHDHRLTNTSDTEDLLFLTVFWEDRGQWDGDREDGEEGQEAEEASAGPAAGAARERALVTAAPATPNGDLHIGHLSGPYLSADYHARYLRLLGVDATFACGSDDNSRWVVGMGESLDLSPEETARRFTDSIVDSLERAGIDVAFHRPNEGEHHHRLVRELFSRLHEQGHLVEKEIPVAWCPRCDEMLFEYRVEGRCAHCGGGVSGHTCEDCGWPNSGGDLLDPECTACGSAAEVRPRRRLVFPVSRFAEPLREAYRRIEMPAGLRAFCEEVLSEGAPDFPATQPGDWGIEVPVPGWEDERINVWVEIGPRYLAYAEILSEGADPAGDWTRYWKSPDARVVQFFGVDNSFYYGVLIPAMFLAFDPDVRLPRALVTNEFYRLDGRKLSTSRNHRILGRDLVDEVPREAVRYYLARTCPEREETNFTREDFRETCRRRLLGAWQSWLEELAERVRDGAGGEVPATGDWTGEQRRFFQRLQALLAEAAEGYAAESFSPQRAIRALDELVREARRFGRGQVHWRRAAAVKGEERRTALALELLAAKVLALGAAPVMPEAAERIWRGLGYDAGPGPGSWHEAFEWVPAGARIDGLGEPVVPGLREALEGARVG
ncbi:MAG: class I tRNA ligase family protein [Acidobacteriota bacterium]